jgi:predicted TIM-barrel fold metal-dependent hydrolase
VFDTSLSHGMYGPERLVRACGTERLVFGTDVYSHVVPQTRNTTLESVVDSGLDDAAKAAILAGNIRRILGLTAA